MCACVRVGVCVLLTSLGLKVGDAVHDDVMQEQGLVVDLDLTRQQATEVTHIPAGEWDEGQETEDKTRERVQF